MGLNFTSTKPSTTAVPSFTHHGNVPLPLCISTLPLLGALASSATAHRGGPLPVTPAVHPAGDAPTASASKLAVCATTPVDTAIAASPINLPLITTSLLQVETING